MALQQVLISLIIFVAVALGMWRMTMREKWGAENFVWLTAVFLLIMAAQSLIK